MALLSFNEFLSENTRNWTYKRDRYSSSGTSFDKWTNSDGTVVTCKVTTEYKKSSKGIRNPKGTKHHIEIHEYSENNGGRPREVFYKKAMGETDESRERVKKAVQDAIKFLTKTYGIDTSQSWTLK